jgi:Large ribosomal RNA subunit accumulation protein YceD
VSEPEFGRPVRIDTLGTVPREMRIEAGAEEREALRRRFGIVALDRLEAEVAVSRNNDEIVAAGTLYAQARQACVVTAEPVPEAIEEPFRIRFRPHPVAAGGEEEIEIDDDEELDVVFYDGALIDVGEAAAQTLALALDPYPRAPHAEEALREAGLTGQGPAGPFGALAGLKDKLGEA